MLATLYQYRWYAIAWIAYGLSQNIVTAFSVIQEFARNDIFVEPWEVFSWELSSGVLSLALIPAILAYDRLFPIDFQRPFSSLAAHLPATLVYSAVHVGGFILIRKWIYSLADRIYTFGELPAELIYEYRKDLLSYLTVLAIVYAYRELRRLRDGETKLAQSEEHNQLSLKLVATKGNQKVVVEPNDIDSIESAGNYVQLSVDDKHYLMRATMQKVAEELKPFNFSRVHRAYIVNESKIVSAKPKNHGGLSLSLSNGSVIECSRRYRQNLKTFVS